MERRYAVILGNLGNTKDRICNGYKESPPSFEMLKQAAKIPHVTGIELVGTWDIRPDNVKEMRHAFDDLGIKCVSIIPDLWRQNLLQGKSFKLRCRDTTTCIGSHSLDV